MDNNIGVSDNNISEIIENLDPDMFILTAEVIGDWISTQLPFNTANAVGNWFNLLGQAMEAYAVQEENVAEYYGGTEDAAVSDYSSEIDELKCTMTDILKELEYFNNQLKEVKEDIKLLKEEK